jgi:hypothetical protein
MDTKQKFELLRAVNLLMQACAKLATSRDDKVCLEIASGMALVRPAMRDAAPEPWEVGAELSMICRNEGDLHCVTPKGFALGEGLLLEQWNKSTKLDGKQVHIEAVREAVLALGSVRALPPVLYFGPLESVGHHLRAPNGKMVNQRTVGEHGFSEQYQDQSYFGLALRENLDGGYVPQECGQVEGCAALTHEAGMTVLGIWDRSIDTRPGSHSTYIALGTFDFATMCKLCQMVYPMRWALLASRVEIKLVQAENIGAAGTGQ